MQLWQQTLTNFKVTYFIKKNIFKSKETNNSCHQHADLRYCYVGTTSCFGFHCKIKLKRCNKLRKWCIVTATYSSLINNSNQKRLLSESICLWLNLSCPYLLWNKIRYFMLKAVHFSIFRSHQTQPTSTSHQKQSQQGSEEPQCSNSQTEEEKRNQSIRNRD